MKYIIAMLCSLSLTGCMYQTVDQYDIHRATVYCGSVTNISYIESTALGGEFATCYDGQRTGLSEVKGVKK